MDIVSKVPSSNPISSTVLLALHPQVGPSKMADMWPKFEEKMKKDPSADTSCMLKHSMFDMFACRMSASLPQLYKKSSCKLELSETQG